MYTLAISKSFTANHFLIGGDWGPENDLHSHDYRVEVRLLGEDLNMHGYLVDIVEFDSVLDALVEHYSGKTLNEQAEFEDLNPSIEHFARIIAQTIGGHLQAPNLSSIEVLIWEDDIAWASFQRDL
ncbi:MAG: 6-carboxytetrahydropterin synthase [Anaerolineales bacterium]|jgi:6-pyruvoyltetrahydropterin/6-carboxytetrahydropterin synthase